MFQSTCGSSRDGNDGPADGVGGIALAGGAKRRSGASRARHSTDGPAPPFPRLTTPPSAVPRLPWCVTLLTLQCMLLPQPFSPAPCSPIPPHPRTRRDRSLCAGAGSRGWACIAARGHRTALQQHHGRGAAVGGSGGQVEKKDLERSCWHRHRHRRGWDGSAPPSESTGPVGGVLLLSSLSLSNDGIARAWPGRNEGAEQSKRTWQWKRS